MHRPVALVFVLTCLSSSSLLGQTPGGSVWSKPVVRSSGPVWRGGGAPPVASPAPVVAAASPARTTDERRAPAPATARPSARRTSTPAKTSNAADEKRPAVTTPAAAKREDVATDPPAVAVPPTIPVVSGLHLAPASPSPAPAAAATKSAAPAPAKAPAPQQIVPAAGSRPTATLPPWLKLTAQYRGRAEALYGSNTLDDAFYLNRLRLQSTITFTPRVQAVVQVQDARAVSYGASATPTSAENTIDVREAYLSVSSTKTNPWSLRVGRQEFALGDARLFTPSDWNNSARSFDGARGGWSRGTTSLLVFAYRPILMQSEAWDRWNRDEIVSGAALTWKHKTNGLMLEPYTIVKHIDAATAGGLDTSIYTYGSRAAGKLPARFDYSLEVALQRGHVKAERVMASAGAYQLGWTAALPWSPRLAGQFNAASGDTDAKDGRKETFDQLYGANHGRFGLVDRIAWRNMRHAGLVVDLTPVKTLKVKGSVHRIYLAETGDGLYTSTSGSRVSARATTASHVGDAADVAFTLELPRKTTLSFGVGYLFAGPFTVEALSANDMWTPHFAWRVLF